MPKIENIISNPTEKTTNKVNNEQVIDITTESNDVKNDEKNGEEKSDEAKKDEKPGKINCKHDANESIVEDQHEGTIVCSKCGVVVVEQVICGLAEWRNFADDTKSDSWERSRVGGPANRFLSSTANLSTSIQGECSAKYGDSFNASILRAAQRKCVDRGILHGLKQLYDMAARINLPDVVLDYAYYLYSKMYKKAKLKGITLHTDAKVPACLYIACYQAECPRTVNEMCGITENDHQSIERAIHRISRLLKLSIGQIKCRDILPRYCAWLNLPRDIQKYIITVAEAFEHLDSQGAFDETLKSAAAIYYATQQSISFKHKRSLKAIADVLGISQMDISECYLHFSKKY